MVHCKLNSNLAAQTIESLRKSRQSICIQVGRELCKETRQLLRQVDSRAINLDELEGQLVGFIEKIRHPEMVSGVKCSINCSDLPDGCAFADAFNDPYVFHGQIMQTFRGWQELMLEAAVKLQNFADQLLAKDVDEHGEPLQEAVSGTCTMPIPHASVSATMKMPRAVNVIIFILFFIDGSAEFGAAGTHDLGAHLK